ncbi:MAG: primosomal protein N', partial [Firmicutes bacterium]|nr:primosomal protein N' [Bacillota bacterium]
MGHHKGLVILGSATPSVVNAYRSRSGLFDLIRLEKRYNEVPLPQVSIVDMREELKQGNHTMFSVELVNAMEETLSRGRQVILFLNRRGYSTFVSCRNCGYTVTCPDCGITMTYHKNENACVCHFCGKKQPQLRTCPECGSTYIRHFGTGTEQVEETVKQFFGNASVARLDLDTVRTKGSIDKILKDFQKGKTQ